MSRCARRQRHRCITFLASWHPVTIQALPRPAAGTFEGLLRVSGPAGRGIAVVGCPVVACGAGGAAGGLVLNRPRRCPPSGRLVMPDSTSPSPPPPKSALYRTDGSSVISPQIGLSLPLPHTPHMGPPINISASSDGAAVEFACRKLSVIGAVSSAFGSSLCHDLGHLARFLQGDASLHPWWRH